MKKSTNKLFLKNYSAVDNIIRFLLNPEDESIKLTDRERDKWTLLKKVQGYRGQYSTKQDIVAIIIDVHEVSERHAYNLINECEQVFGTVHGVNKAFERNWLLEVSKKNIQIAIGSRNSKNISYAILAHAKLAGLDDQVVDQPDFSELEPNQYKVELPPQILAIMSKMIETGTLSLDDFVPPQDLNTLGIQEAEVIPTNET